MSASNPTKSCSRCKRDLPPTEFSKCRANKDGLQYRCRECSKELYASYKQDNLEREMARQRQYARDNAEAKAEYARQWFRDNRERVNEMHREWCKSNPHKVAAKDHRRRARKASVPSDGIALDITDQVCYICGAPAEAVDHVVPLSKGGHDTIGNKQPVCKSCNSAKRDYTWPGQPDWPDFVARRNQDD